MTNQNGDRPTHPVERWGFAEALEAILDSVDTLESEYVPLDAACGRVAAEDLVAQVDSPSVDASLRDGYAVHSDELRSATVESPVTLHLVGSAPAGGAFEGHLGPVQAIRILTGAPIPSGADAVLADEYATCSGEFLMAEACAERGRNILPRGSDASIGTPLVDVGTTLRPAHVGLLAAMGHESVEVVRQPRVSIIATGDEVVAPGNALPKGKLYASNLVTLAAFCRCYGMAAETHVVCDDFETIHDAIDQALSVSDAVLTSGGAWQGERDLTVHVLAKLGWHEVFHRVRLGPGKAVGFGLCHGKPVFVLPGGPPSNLAAFLELALPGLMKMAGHARPGLPLIPAILAETISGQRDWTQLIEGRLEYEPGSLRFRPRRLASRLESMAGAEAYIRIPEGTESITAGTAVEVELVPFALA